MLEFTSTQPAREAKAFLAEMAHILSAIFCALQKRESAYASVLGALLELAGEKTQAVTPEAEEALDESWAEPPVFGGCSTKGQARPGDPQPIQMMPRKAQPGVVSTAGPSQGRPHERGEAQARSARPRVWTADDTQLSKSASDGKEAANNAPSGGSVAAPAASVGVVQP